MLPSTALFLWTAVLALSLPLSGALRRVVGDGDGEDAPSNYVIGTGIYDMTGPASQINFMGYAEPEETGHGIHLRLRARTFIVAEPPIENDHDGVNDENAKQKATAQYRLRRQDIETKNSETDFNPYPHAGQLDPEKTICFVSMDIGMGSDLLNIRVLERLNALLPKQASSDKRLCHMDNLSLSGTHTHSSPGGFIQYALYQVTSAGFSEQTINAYAEGVAQSILRAYQNLGQGSITVSEGMLFDANINRSPSSYLLNPQSERDEYSAEGDTDKRMLQLNFKLATGEQVGILNWFAVHGTSMNKTNTLISGDNKGYASYLMEKKMNGATALPGQGKFVAAFASTNLGDVSPNTAGPRCIDTGLPCDFVTSTCNGVNTKCIAFGPGRDMVQSTEIIGRKQFDMASLLLHENEHQTLSGGVAFRHSFVDLSNRTVELPDGTMATTCPAALGYSFAAGTTDGPGSFAFKQSTNTSNPFWNMIGEFVSKPTKEQIKCQSPKPILLNTGCAIMPYAWDPNLVPVSVFRVGSHFILNVPAEFTTMSGRRLRRAIKSILVERGINDATVSIAGLANSYTHYVTTFEEYVGQRYEAASTLYGPHTLLAYIQIFERLTRDLLDNVKSSEPDDPPKDLSGSQISLTPDTQIDLIGWGRTFGSVAIDAEDEYVGGNDTVFVSFRSSNPRNDLRTEGTFLTVDLLLDDGTWETRYVDGDWSTRFYWKSNIETFGTSFAEISWDIPVDATQGIYRICHFGTRKTILGDTSWASLHLPDWVSSDGLGSTGVGILYQTVRLADAFIAKVRRTLTKLYRPRLREFSGCSRSFLVHANKNNTDT